jgi:hypothetical protein
MSTPNWMSGHAPDPVRRHQNRRSTDRRPKWDVAIASGAGVIFSLWGIYELSRLYFR